MTVYFFEQGMVVPGALLGPLEDALRRHIGSEDRANRDVDIELRKFADALDELLTSTLSAPKSAIGHQSRMDMGGDVVGVAEAASRLNLCERQVRRKCAAGQFPGARKLGRGWAIPVTAIK